jgi:putative pyruvate formate lyase activating enzyme
MATSRREFVWKSTAAIAGATFLPLHCHATNVSDRGADPDFVPGYLKLEREGELKGREEALWARLESCDICARGCGANRMQGEVGVCSTKSWVKVASYGPHHGEETELRGSHGSGTVFFSHCNLLCDFCLNWEINHRGDGQRSSTREIADMMLDLQSRGCHNINFVTPSHVVPQIVSAARLAANRGLRLPLVYNTGGYDNLEVIKLLDGVFDIYLPDFKYQDGELAGRYSSAADDYPEVAAACIREMQRQVGDLKVDSNGIATRGLIVRHLVMPNNISGTDRFTKWVADELGPNTYVNLMAQYRPRHKAFDDPKINRRLTQEEWQQAVAWAEDAGLTNVRT